MYRRTKYVESGGMTRYPVTGWDLTCDVVFFFFGRWWKGKLAGGGRVGPAGKSKKMTWFEKRLQRLTSVFLANTASHIIM